MFLDHLFQIVARIKSICSSAEDTVRVSGKTLQDCFKAPDVVDIVDGQFSLKSIEQVSKTVFSGKTPARLNKLELLEIVAMYSSALSAAGSAITGLFGRFRGKTSWQSFDFTLVYNA